MLSILQPKDDVDLLGYLLNHQHDLEKVITYLFESLQPGQTEKKPQAQK